MSNATKTFQCEVNGNAGLTVVVPLPNRYIDDIQISIGPIGKMDKHVGVYLNRTAVAALLQFIQSPVAS